VPPARRGPVRIEGRAIADSAGPFNALGATMFWAAWGYRADRARLERNLAVLRDAGVDYVRVLGSVGGTSWADRQVDPGWNDYDAVVAGLTDLVYDRYGLRIQWTLFGGAPFTPPGPAREALVDRFAKLARGREHKIMAFEIANEAWSNGFQGPDGLGELRRLGKRLNDQTTVLIALSAAAPGAACATYADTGADIATVHYERGFGREGALSPLRRPWAYPAEYDAKCQGRLPPVAFNNEPIGPESSVRQDDDPSRIAAGFVMTFLAGNAAYVFHSGPGIRGGGAADVAAPLHRHADFGTLPSFKPIMAALRTAKSYLPPGLPNWTRQQESDTSAPLQGFDAAERSGAITGAYTAASASDFISLVVGVRKPVVIRARAASSIDVRRPGSAAVLQRVELGPGDAFTLSTQETVVLIGRGKSD
jgi:hypothetical protein